MKRHARTLPLFITMVAMLAFAAPGYGSLGTPVGNNTTVGRAGSGLPAGPP